MNNNNASTNLKELSLQLMNTVWFSSVIVLPMSVLNCILAILALIVLRAKSVTLSSNVFVLVRFCFVNDFFFSIYLLVYNSWHLANYLRAVPEVMAVELCFYVTCWQTFFLAVDEVSQVALAFDRLFCVISPIGYSRTTKNQYRVIVGVCCLLALLYLSGSFLDTWLANPGNTTTAVVLYCSLRSSIGLVYSYFLYVNPIIIDSAAVFTYLIVIAVIKCQFDHLTATHRIRDRNQSRSQGEVRGQNQSESYGRYQGQSQNTAVMTAAAAAVSSVKRREKMMKNLTKVTALDAVFSFIIGPVEFSLSLIFKVWFPDLVLRIGQYIAVLVLCNSSVNFMLFFIFMPEFRRGVIDILKMINRRILSRVSPRLQQNVVQVAQVCKRLGATDE